MKARTRALPILALCVALAGCAGTATVSIPAGEEFVLGEYQDAGYRVDLKNLGDQIVQIRAVDRRTGEQTQGFGLDPGGSAKLYISSREVVRFGNDSGEDAKVRARLSKNVEGMRYEPMGE